MQDYDYAVAINIIAKGQMVQYFNVIKISKFNLILIVLVEWWLIFIKYAVIT